MHGARGRDQRMVIAVQLSASGFVSSEFPTRFSSTFVAVLDDDDDDDDVPAF